MSPRTSGRKDLLREDIASHQQSLVPTARPQSAELPSDLAIVVAAWSDLPDAIRAGIVAMIEGCRR
jgi:hypothetical protein